MPDNRGIFRKFIVKRTDGQDAPGMKHCACRYFVLDLDHDPHANAALEAYTESCKEDRPQLAAELREVLRYPAGWLDIDYLRMNAPTKFEVFMNRDEIRRMDEDLKKLQDSALPGEVDRG